MPALQRIIPSRGKFWDTLDPNNVQQVLEAVKEEFQRPEPAYELHYLSSKSTGSPTGDHKPCYRDCLIFLLRGEFIINGQGRFTEAGCAYRVKDETWLWLCGTTTIVVTEEGEERGRCLRDARSSGTFPGREGWSQKDEEERKKLLSEQSQAIQSSARIHQPW